MVAPLHNGRLIRPATILNYLRQPPSSYTPLVFLVPATLPVSFPSSTRALSFFPRDRSANKDNKSSTSTTNTLVENYLKTKQARRAELEAAGGAPTNEPGSLAPDSIFDDVEDQPTRAPTAGTSPKDGEERRSFRGMQLALDPNPRKRLRWQRKQVERLVRRQGWLTKAEKLRQTERQSLSRSPFFKTSVKKLGMLARQIQGKTVDEALLQMRFSKKGVARELKQFLEHARNEAVAKRGMGLANVPQLTDAASDTPSDLSAGVSANVSAKASISAEAAKGLVVQPESPKKVKIELKDGRWKEVADRSEIYIDQAWVGRGPYGRGLDHRARGRINILRLPYTSVSVLLKEEATRVRLSEEMHRKRDNRKLWTQLKERPIYAQRQYCLW